MTRRDGALNGLKMVLDLDGWRKDLSLYAVLLGHFAAQRDGQGDRAKTLLEDAATRCDTSAWPYPIVKYLRGEIDEPKLLAAATDKDKMTEVRCYLGLEVLKKAKRTRPGRISAGSRNTVTRHSRSTRLP